MGDYRERANPPQEPGTDYECLLCGAIVVNRQRHTLAVHTSTDGAVDAEQRQGSSPDTKPDPRMSTAPTRDPRGQQTPPQ